MPERLIGAVRVSRVDFSSAIVPKLDPYTYAWVETLNFIQNLLFVLGMNTYMYINIASSTLSKDLLEINNVFRMGLNIELEKL